MIPDPASGAPAPITNKISVNAINAIRIFSCGFTDIKTLIEEDNFFTLASDLYFVW